MKAALIVIDMQNDFIAGELGSPEARAIVPGVVQKIEMYERHGGDILLTLDTHEDDYLETEEGKKLPVEHCINGTEGWLLAPEISNVVNRCESTIISKVGFGFMGWPQFIDKNIEYIEIVGVCTDICVITNALLLKTFYPKTEIIVDASCCAGTTPDAHRAAIRVMENCLINVINQAEISK